MKRIHLIILMALLSVLTVDAKKHKQLVILHTNDTHSAIMPLNVNLDNTSARVQAITRSLRVRWRLA